MRNPSEHVLERLAFNEERVSDCLKEIRETRAFWQEFYFQRQFHNTKIVKII